ncbi:MAG: cytochrome c3 family protein [Bacteroidota bacterium]
MRKTIFILFVLLFGFNVNIDAQSIVTTKHNLSVSGTGDVKATTESEICIFCHTPHNSNPAAPLWNRADQGVVYTLYSSSTLQALPGQPDGSSMLCLSCHDGTTALGNVLSQSTIIDFSSTINMPIGKSNLATDLRDDHPISFVYDATLASSDPQLKTPSTITFPVTLENGKMQCTSCHDPHSSVYEDFLLASTQYSDLCNSCHQRTDWSASIHSTSVKTWNGVAPDPWPNTSWTTVAENACENCHNPHQSGGVPRLLKYQTEESNCFDCHNGNVVGNNMQLEFLKTYKHDVYAYTDIHDAAESAIPMVKHVECVDCHNPHAAKYEDAVAPFVKGSNAGAVGIDQNGNTVSSVTYEYEICYRCHSVNSMTASSTARQIAQNNVSLEFAFGNPSYHPVASVGTNTDVPSLIAPLTTSSWIYCTDCHGSNSPVGAQGPHGSIYNDMLRLQYIKTDNTTESVANYALCYKCHSRASILADESFGYHYKHIVEEKTPCNVCHDAHGISSTQGNSTYNTNLINFQNTIVSNSGSGTRSFVDTGLHHGTCILTCHGEDHDPKAY